MNLAGVLAVIDNESYEGTLAEVSSLCGVEVDFDDRASGNVLLTISAPTQKGQKIILDKLKALPLVLHAQIVYYYRDEEDSETPVTSSLFCNSPLSDAPCSDTLFDGAEFRTLH